MRLHREGYCQYEIAEKLDVSSPTVSRDMKAIIADMQAAARRDRFEMLSEELSKLDRDESDLRYELTQEDRPARRARIRDQIMKVMERRAKMLGLDDPEKLLIGDWREEVAMLGEDPNEVFNRLVEAAKQSNA